MAPIIFNDLMAKKAKIQKNSFKSELFTLGMICLSMFANPDDVQKLYSSEYRVFLNITFADILATLDN